MKTRTLHHVLLAMLVAASAGCEDMAAPADKAASAEAPARPALSVVEVARVAIVVEDALTRLLPAAEAEASALDASLRELAAMLSTGDAVTLHRQIQQTLRALDAQSMDDADVDAVRLALALVAEAADSSVDNGQL